MKIELTNVPLLSPSELIALASSLDVIHQKTLKSLERLAKDLETRKKDIASRWKNAGLSMEDQARYSESETLASVRQIRENAQAELNGLLKSAGKPHAELIAQRQFYSSAVQVLSRVGLGSQERTNYSLQVRDSGPAELAHLAQVAVSTKNATLAAALLSVLDATPTASRPVSGQSLARAMELPDYEKAQQAIALGDARLQAIIVAVRAFNQGKSNPLDSVSLALRERSIEKGILGEGDAVA